MNILSKPCSLLTLLYSADLGDAELTARAQTLQDDLIGDPRQASRSAPKAVQTEDGFARTGGTAFERDHRSQPIANTDRAIPVTISVEPQKSGLHAPTAGNQYVDVPGAGLEAQDPGFHLRRRYSAVGTFSTAPHIHL